MKRLRYRLAYLLRLLAWRIEPPHVFDGTTLADMITRIEPQDTPVLTEGPGYILGGWNAAAAEADALREELEALKAKPWGEIEDIRRMRPDG